MLRRSLAACLYLLALCLSLPGFANTYQDYLHQAEKRQLANAPEWQALLHYRAGLFSSEHQSQADDPSFFVSNSGAVNPHQELQASIKALFDTAPADQHFSCRFPARTHWIQQQLNIPAADIPRVECPELDYFRKQLNAKRINLIFAATYLNSPSSMFGHTFLRIDTSKAKDANLLLSNTISYAADVREMDSEIMFAYRGIFGGYPGVTSVVPYYEKLKQYIDMENRDIWEFELNFTQAEIDQLVNHAWELMNKNFDYYFFDENCAYRLLSLMDVARPGTNLIEDVAYQAIPSDTVRWVVDKDLVAQVRYRPSTSSTVQSQVYQLNPEAKQAVLDIVRHGKPIDTALEPFDNPSIKAHILDTSYEYARYDTVKAERTREETAKLSHRLLMKRSRLGQQPPMTPPEPPAVRDDQGHDTVRVAARVGEQAQEPFVELDLRPAYHDLSDIPDGYPEGTQLRFLSTRFRYWWEDDDLDAEELTLVDIKSISPRDEFFKPTSWKVAVGGIRSELIAERPFAAYLKGGSGLATRFADGLLFGFIQGSLQSHRDLNKGYALGPGIELGWTRQRSNYQTYIALDHDHYMEGHETDSYSLSLRQGFTLAKDQQWMMTFLRNKIEGFYHSEWRLEFRQFL